MRQQFQDADLPIIVGEGLPKGMLGQPFQPQPAAPPAQHGQPDAVGADVQSGAQAMCAAAPSLPCQ